MAWILRFIVLMFWIASLDLIFGMGALVGMFDPQRAQESIARTFKFFSLVGMDYEICAGEDPLLCGFRDTSDRKVVDCQAYLGERSAVLMTFGQSNSANAGHDRYIPQGDVANFNIFDGQCYRAEDPLLGPDAKGGSVWGVLADKLIARGDYDSVLIVPFGIGGSALGQWQQGDVLYPLLQKAMQATKDADIEPTHILWHQGESDAARATSESDYYLMFEALVETLRSAGFKAPVLAAVATHCQMFVSGTEPERLTAEKAVRAAQQRLPELEGVFAGPDTDTIQGALYRDDNCHFNARGMQAHAAGWVEAISATEEF